MNKRRRGIVETRCTGGRSNENDEGINYASKSNDSLRSCKYIQDIDVCRALFSESKINSDSEQLYQHLWIALDGLENTISNVDLIIDRVQNNPFAMDDRDDEMNQLGHVSDADDVIERYNSEGDMVELRDDLTDEGRDMI